MCRDCFFNTAFDARAVPLLSISPLLLLCFTLCFVKKNTRAVLAVTSEYHPKLLDLGITRIDGSDKHFLKYRWDCVVLAFCVCSFMHYCEPSLRFCVLAAALAHQLTDTVALGACSSSHALTHARSLSTPTPQTQPLHAGLARQGL